MLLGGRVSTTYDSLQMRKVKKYFGLRLMLATYITPMKWPLILVVAAKLKILFVQSCA